MFADWLIPSLQIFICTAGIVKFHQLLADQTSTSKDPKLNGRRPSATRLSFLQVVENTHDIWTTLFLIQKVEFITFEFRFGFAESDGDAKTRKCLPKVYWAKPCLQLPQMWPFAMPCAPLAKPARRQKKPRAPIFSMYFIYVKAGQAVDTKWYKLQLYKLSLPRNLKKTRRSGVKRWKSWGRCWKLQLGIVGRSHCLEVHRGSPWKSFFVLETMAATTWLVNKLMCPGCFCSFWKWLTICFGSTLGIMKMSFFGRRLCTKQVEAGIDTWRRKDK